MGLIWRIPSFYGDIQLERIHEKSCRVIVEQATVQERIALQALQATAIKKKWVPEGTIFAPEETLGKATTEVQHSIEKVAKLIAKALKPGRKLVSAIRFADGKMQEVLDAPLVLSKVTPTPTSSTVPSETQSEPMSSGDRSDNKVEVATTVAAPVRGCPPPTFDPARLRAWKALMAFLDRDQQEDFVQYDRFVSTGADTGHSYMITSRLAPDALQRFGGRSLYDLEERRAYCTHDWGVPPEEELLGLHVFLSLPGREEYLRHLE